MDRPVVTMKPVEALCFAVAIVALMGVMMIGLGWVPQLAIVVVLGGLFLFGAIKKVPFSAMQAHMAGGVMSGIGAIYLFFFIGLLVAALMMSGAIPTLMYYGFDLVSPSLFYLSAFVLTSVVGVALGSSLTTCATLGVAFIGMGAAFGANPAIIAGAVVSGAFFGDKMSPLSDTCSIAASVVGIDLFEHIRNMMHTTVPAWVITAALFFMMSPDGAGDLAAVAAFRENLLASGLVNPVALLPIVLLLVLAMMKVHAIYTIMITIAVAIVITYFGLNPTLSELGGYFFAGFQAPESLGEVSSLLSRGGLQSMFFSMSIIVLALSLGGLLNALGILPALLDGVHHLLTKASRAIAAAAFTAFGVNLLIGEQYLSVLLTGNTFRPVYEELGLHPKNLSRTLEDAGTVINPLVPWSVCGVFIAEVLGVSVISYLPYAFFCYLCLILTLIFGMTGFTITKITPKTV
ncbi:Sodium/proton antiporter [Moraxella caviae]|nr:Na+/H+ antiporter NhaC [Moraxella caviae]STZ09811.1 Sodium/proton antiporter [Moraxella caviae]